MTARDGAAFAGLRDRYDVIVAGARCAGASVAMLLARRGLRVLVVDPVPPHRDALSTHALMRGAVLQLHRWGVLDGLREAGTPPVRRTVFHYGSDTVAVPVEEADGVDALYAPRRTVLDPALRRAAVAAGAELVHGAAVVDLRRGRGGRVRGVVVAGPGGVTRSIGAELVVGADGVNSRVARLVDAAVDHAGRHASATVYGYWEDPHPGEYHWLFAPGASAGSISTNGGRACVFAALPRGEFRRRRVEGLEHLHRTLLEDVSPALAEHVARRAPDGRLHAFAGVPGFLRRSWGPGWALVGDAGYFKDPATAHGITDALRDAELLADAVSAGSDAALRRYQELRDAVVGGFMDVTERIASFGWDLGELRPLHLALAREMKAGLTLVRDLGPLPAPEVADPTGSRPAAAEVGTTI